MAQQNLAFRITADPRFAEWCLLVLFSRQSWQEKRYSSSFYKNKIGFDAADALALSKIARRLEAGKTLSDDEQAVLRKRLPRYHRQISTALSRLMLGDKAA